MRDKLTQWSKAVVKKLMVPSWLRNSLPFIESESSLPLSQEPATEWLCPLPV